MTEKNNVVVLPGAPDPHREIPEISTDADDILTDAFGGILKDVVVIGWDQDGDFYFDASTIDGPAILWLLETAKQGILGG